jgi:hypothetical protein
MRLAGTRAVYGCSFVGNTLAVPDESIPHSAPPVVTRGR